MKSEKRSYRDKLVRRHNAATVVAALAFFIAVLASKFAGNLLEPVRQIAYLILLAAMLVMHWTRNADEYVATIWRSSTNAAFVAIVFLLVFAPLLEGFWDGLTGNESGQDFTADSFGMPVALATFFIANLWARLRGTF